LLRRSFLDSNVLIAAHHGEAIQREAALSILADADRVFIATPFLALELLPPAIYNRNAAEAEFYRAYFRQRPTLER
jgi:predicted nucleic acid-binding protein